MSAGLLPLASGGGNCLGTRLIILALELKLYYDKINYNEAKTFAIKIAINNLHHHGNINAMITSPLYSSGLSTCPDHATIHSLFLWLVNCKVDNWDCNCMVVSLQQQG